MSRLPEDNPEIHFQLINGAFSVQIRDKNPFGRIPVDQTLRKLQTKDTQTAGGTKGFNLKPASVRRYYLTAEFRATCLKQVGLLTDTQVWSS